MDFITLALARKAWGYIPDFTSVIMNHQITAAGPGMKCSVYSSFKAPNMSN